MEGDLRRFVTARGLAGAGLFVISGLAYLLLFRSNLGIWKALIAIGFLILLAPSACLWINRKAQPVSEHPKLIG
jgi:hypothetical protein